MADLLFLCNPFPLSNSWPTKAKNITRNVRNIFSKYIINDWPASIVLPYRNKCWGDSNDRLLSVQGDSSILREDKDFPERIYCEIIVINHAILKLLMSASLSPFSHTFRNDLHKFGVSVDIKNFTVAELVHKMALVIEDPMYRKNIQKASRILHKRQMNAHETAVFWIEHVIEFGGGHLRSHALDMPWYSYYMIDILVFLLVVTSILMTFLCVFCYCTLSRFCKNTKVAKEKIN